MTYLDKWLAEIDNHLASVTPHELEENYLRVKDDIGPKIQEYLSYEFGIAYLSKSYFLSKDKTKFISLERISVKFDKVPSVRSAFQMADNDETYDVAA
jgi:hypothetical protein